MEATINAAPLRVYIKQCTHERGKNTKHMHFYCMTLTDLQSVTYHFFFFMKLEKRDTKKKKKLHNLMKKSITTYRGIKKEDRPKFSREETMHLVYYMHRSFTIITYGLI